MRRVSNFRTTKGAARRIPQRSVVPTNESRTIASYVMDAILDDIRYGRAVVEDIQIALRIGTESADQAYYIRLAESSNLPITITYVITCWNRVKLVCSMVQAYFRSGYPTSQAWWCSASEHEDLNLNSFLVFLVTFASERDTFQS